MTQTTALILTLVIELPIAVGLARALGSRRDGLVAAAAVGASLLTHPILWMSADLLTTPLRLVGAELIVAAVETVAYALAAGLGWRKGLVVSVVANGASFGLGLLLT